MTQKDKMRLYEVQKQLTDLVAGVVEFSERIPHLVNSAVNLANLSTDGDIKRELQKISHTCLDICIAAERTAAAIQPKERKS